MTAWSGDGFFVAICFANATVPVRVLGDSTLLFQGACRGQGNLMARSWMLGSLSSPGSRANRGCCVN
jgi:hypothetical protein